MKRRKKSPEAVHEEPFDLEAARAREQRRVSQFFIYLAEIGLVAYPRVTEEQRRIDDARQSEREARCKLNVSPAFWLAVQAMQEAMNRGATKKEALKLGRAVLRANSPPRPTPKGRNRSSGECRCGKKKDAQDSPQPTAESLCQ